MPSLRLLVLAACFVMSRSFAPFYSPIRQQGRQALGQSHQQKERSQHQHQQQQQQHGHLGGEIRNFLTCPGPGRRSSSSASSSSALFGIPKMFRWLTDQYPNILNDRLSEGLAEDADVDAFYLDMNGIIHPCTHGNAQDGVVILDETAMFKKIFMYVDRLYKMVGPNKVLYLAVDGVAPRAKMNQQRSRRFRSAKEAEMLAADVAAQELFRERQRVEKKYNNLAKDAKRFDSNCITPGTDFMLKLSLALQKWVDYKMQSDPFWQTGAQVIVSGPDVPGEGEHKVMDFIRDSRDAWEKKGDGEDTDHYGRGWTHVLYGLDADLIMLGLVTHEPNFMLLREKMSVVMGGRGRGGKYRKKKDMMEYTRNDFELLELSSLRKLLALQFRPFAGQLENFELSRVIDDFVFMCILVGNDFLPHCPHMEIDSGAISLMLATYLDLLPGWGGYLTLKEKIDPDRFEEFIYNLAVYEEEHFRRRGFEENEPGWKLPSENERNENDFYGTFFSGNPTPECAVAANVKGSLPPPSILKDDDIGKSGDDESDDGEGSSTPVSGVNRAFRRRHSGSQARSYRDFYYESKLGWKVEDRERTLFMRRAHVRDYLEGLHWVLHYYHRGCGSWDWYFPHLYAPLATDIVNLREFYIDEPEGEKEVADSNFLTFPFDDGTPFPSLAQLLSVLPPQSADLLPDALSELMIDPMSPLLSYYPPDFESDPNGKRQPWEAVVQIPFIDADVLLDSVQRVLEDDERRRSSDRPPLLSAAERRRNTPGKDHFFVPKGTDGSTTSGAQPKDGNKQKSIPRTPKGGERPMVASAKGVSNGDKKMVKRKKASAKVTEGSIKKPRKVSKAMSSAKSSEMSG